MTRRRFVALVSALTLVALCIVAVLLLLSITNTSYGLDKVRGYLESRIASRVRGSVHIGAMNGSLLGGVTIDSIEIRDTSDALFFASGPVTIQYDIRDFFDRRIWLERLEVERPTIRLEQDEEGTWNFRKIFPRAPRRLPRIEGGLGDFIVADTVAIRGGSVIVTTPWNPASYLTGGQRDSAITANLVREDAEINRTKDGIVRTRRWTDIDLQSSYVRWADPDSVGRYVDIRALSALELDPPVTLRSAEGSVEFLADSLWLDIPRFSIAASSGSAKGKIVWGSDLPTRYDVDIRGDSVSLSDIGWVYPTLPPTGTGSMSLAIQTRADNLRIIDYAITDMDVRTTGSRLRGDMTFGVGARVLDVTDVDLEAAPVDFKLIETLSGAPLPVPWAGTIRGTVRGPGGPVTRFVVDEARLALDDANVRGAVTRASARGELDILAPSLTSFHGLEVDVEQLDLRTIEYLFPNFPRLGGRVAGRATLDSLWLDVRFRDADVTHTHDGGPPTRVTGSGRVTYGEPFLSYDVDLVADSVSFTSLARSYPALPLRGSYAGPIRARGTTEALDITTTLSGAAGRMGFDGRVDIYPPGYAARGRASIIDLDFARLLARSDLPATRLSAQFEGDVVGDSLANLIGQLALEVSRSRVGSIMLRQSRARLRFADRRMHADDFEIASDRFTVTAKGGFGLAAGVRDTLDYQIRIDSLGALRPWLKPVDSARVAMLESPDDSLGGEMVVAGHVAGGVLGFDVAGTLRGQDMAFGRHRARALGGEIDLRDALGTPSGEIRVRTDTVLLAGTRLDHLTGVVQITDAANGRVAFETLAADFRAAATAAYRLSGDTTELMVDTVRFQPEDGHDWRLVAPTRITAAGRDLSIGQTLFAGPGSGRIAIAGTLPAAGAISVRIDADSVDLHDVAVLTQGRAPLTGWLDVGLSIAGTRAAPTMQADAQLASAQFGEVRTERITARASYADRRVTADLGLVREGARVVSANVSVPVDLALMSVGQRLLDEPLGGTIRADSVDLRLLESFTTQVQRASGRLRARIDLSGTARRPSLLGSLQVERGTVHLPGAGIDLRSLRASLDFSRDSIVVREVSAQSGALPGNVATLSGSIGLDDRSSKPSGLSSWILGEDPSFDLRFVARDFHILQRPQVAFLWIRSNLQLAGSMSGARLTGNVTVPVGSLFIPELIQKPLVDLTGIDTTLTMNRGIVRDAPSRLLENLDIQGVDVIVGDEVWLRSTEARIQLGGSVSVRSVKVPARDAFSAFGAGTFTRPDSMYRLALEGVLTADRGQFRLNLNVVQRTFRVEQGTVAFFGDADLNPTLDIVAYYTVRTAEGSDPGRDLRIRVHIFGTLAQPQIRLSSDETIPIPDSDLISYLVTGSPQFELGAEGQSSLRTAAAILLPSLGSMAEGLFAGSGFDLFQVETGNLGGTNGTDSNLSDLIQQTRLGVGKQITKRTFVSATTNLCQIDELLALDTDTFLRSVGLKLEHILNSGFSVALGIEPGSTALNCGRPQRTFLQSPPQVGLDLFKVWRF